MHFSSVLNERQSSGFNVRTKKKKKRFYSWVNVVICARALRHKGTA
jgi:hypothetical protein